MIKSADTQAPDRPRFDADIPVASIAKKPRISDEEPNPGNIAPSILSERTEAEEAIMKQFKWETASIGGNAYILAHFIATGAVNLAQYMRSVDEHPEKREHFERLIGIQEQSPNRWIRHYAEWQHASGEEGPAIVDEAITIIEATDWTGCDIMPVFDADTRQIYFDVPEQPESNAA